jgi:hypothetical protein
MGQHCQRPLVDRLAVDLEARVILWRPQTANRFWRLRSGLRWDRRKRGSER